MDRDERFLRECLVEAQRQLERPLDLEAAPEPDLHDYHVVYVRAPDESESPEVLVRISGRLMRERNRVEVVRRIKDAVQEREE